MATPEPDTLTKRDVEQARRRAAQAAADPENLRIAREWWALVNGGEIPGDIRNAACRWVQKARRDCPGITTGAQLEDWSHALD